MRALFFSLPVLVFSIVSLNTRAETQVPDFTVQVGQDQNAKAQGWLLNFLPPAKHHFNKDAPMSVTALDGSVSFIKVGAKPEHVGFRLSDPRLKEGMEITASVFLCDQAQTYCIKKKQTFSLKVNSDLTALEPADAQVTSAKKVSKGAKKDAYGFWDNRLEDAIIESAKTKKPILIGFFGIWCPPCNLFRETVFPTQKFKQATQKWVLLKMDVDAKESFELKSHFKVGGYPTIVAVQAVKDPNASISSLSEIDRIVGFYPTDEFVHLLGNAYLERGLNLEEKLAARKKEYLGTLKQLIEVDLEKKEFKEVVKLSDDGAAVSQDHYFALNKIYVRANEDAKVVKEKQAVDLVDAIWTNRANEQPDTLLRTIDILTSHSEQFTKSQIARANDLLDQLAKEVEPATLSVPGVELSIADIDSLRVDVAVALDDPALELQAYSRVVASYKELIQKFKAQNSRGYNLELAYALWKSGKVDEAKAIYERFIVLYPKEFTFYYAAAKMYLDLKILPTARDYAEKAVKFAYGDNKLRSMERLMRVMIAQGENSEALKRGREFFQEVGTVSSDLFVRTNRYVQAFKKALDEVQKENHK